MMDMVPYMRIRLTLAAALMVAAVFLAACGPGEPPVATPDTGASLEGGVAPTAAAGDPAAATSTAPSADAGQGYPAPVAPTMTPASYPVEAPPTLTPTPLPGSYPAPTTEVFLEPRFRFDVPLQAGATNVTGQAPPNLSLAVLDVTFNGALLGTGRSDESGRFSIPVTPLPAGNRIGLLIGELPEGQSLSQLAETYFPYRGDGFMNLPNVGVLYETALVEP
jgi:hypothetical protein